MKSSTQPAANALALRRPPAKTTQQDIAAQLDRARADAVAAQRRADEARAKMIKSSRDSKVRLRVTAVVMMTAALLKLAWQAASSQPPPPSAAILQPLPSSSSASSLPVRPTVDASASAAALDRLRDAFHSFPDQDQPDIVREVNERYANQGLTCNLAWKDGSPALSVGGKDANIPPMMARALDRCAEGIEKLRAEKDAAASSAQPQR